MKLIKIALFLTLFISLIGLAEPLYLVAKAEVAQKLLNFSWQKSQQDQQQHKPWYWADTYPVAKLQIDHDELIVLAGMNGRNMAFGPSWSQQSAAPNHYGNTVISAHNDSHFAMLENISQGDLIRMENSEGISFEYAVSQTLITTEEDARWLQPTDSRRITLITCYPFEATEENKKQRLIVIAEAV